jgi:hypothetical protein
VHIYGYGEYGKVDTRPGIGARYYHIICWNSFLHDPISLLSFFILRTIEPLFENNYFWFFCCYHVIYSNRVRSRLFINKGRYTYLGPLRGRMYLICMLCNMNFTPSLTFPFEYSSMTYPFGFDKLL